MYSSLAEAWIPGPASLAPFWALLCGLLSQSCDQGAAQGFQTCAAYARCVQLWRLRVRVGELQLVVLSPVQPRPVRVRITTSILVVASGAT